MTLPLNARPRELARAVAIAKRVRTACEAVQRLYPRQFDPSLGGMCEVASLAVLRLLKRSGIKARAVLGEYRMWPHLWVEAAGHVIDVTATQFKEIARNDKVHVEPIPNRRYFKGKRYFRTCHCKDWATPDVDKAVEDVMRRALRASSLSLRKAA